MEDVTRTPAKYTFDFPTRHLLLMNLNKKHPVLEKFCLPTEILAIIINQVASDTVDNDRTLAALAACRLASHVLCSLATPFFFSSIRLTDIVLAPLPSCEKILVDSCLLSNRAKNLNDILSIDDIADSVKTLTLHCSCTNLPTPPNGNLISKILHRLPNIQTFVLEAFYTESEGSYLQFSDLEKDFRSAIQALCKSPTLTTLYLDNVNGFPITVIAACPNLRHLRLWCAELDVNLFFFSCTFTTTNATFQFDGTDSTDETLGLQPPHLDSLEIDHDTLYYCPDDDASFANIFWSRLRNLQIKSLFYSAAVMHFGWDIILSISQTLTTLDLLEGRFLLDFAAWL